MEITLLFGLIILNGMFAMSEIALVTARKGRLVRLANAGDGAAQVAIELGEEPTKFLSTVQIGITSIGVLNGMVGEATLAAPLAMWLQSLGTPLGASEFTASALVVVAITYFTIVLGELVPKRLAQINPEPLARAVARPMRFLAIVAKPFVMLLSSSTRLILRLFGVKDSGQQPITEDDLHMILEEGSEAGIIEHQEHRMVRNLFRLDDRQISSFMVPRGEVVCLNVEDDFEVNLKRLEASPHSRFPVIRGGWGDILGVATARQMLAQLLRGERPELAGNLEEPVYLPESLTGMELLENFKSSGTQLAFIVDEYGQVQGIVTLQDVLESITGEFKTHHAEDAWAVRREDGSWLLDGLIPIPELKDCLALSDLPEESRGRYNTLSGMLLLLLGDIPKTGEICTWGSWKFEIVDLDGLRIDKVLASPLARQTGNGGAR
ncbi:HlyC/CorC family transporter [Massilia sp. RP-1-19]|uniref:HlyC/CorC family transporter n=1 Tax=Massilia polaris TaxID=2728846 RepID=A0A848HFJ4_9BURK|nr:hemolysin family protein [Massilia polaris]NML60215.1 HlyC/CorC family transporter [Massilia polaris]